MATIILDLYEFKNICMEMSDLGGQATIKRLMPGKDTISQRQAYTDFGETKVRHWVRIGLVSTTRLGPAKNSKKGYSRHELMSAAEAEKLEAIINRNSQLQ